MEALTLSAIYLGAIILVAQLTGWVVRSCGLRTLWLRRSLPATTERQMTPRDCMLATTGILCQVLEGREVRAFNTLYIHFRAQQLIKARGMGQTWDEFILANPEPVGTYIWKVLRDRLGLPEATSQQYESNPHLQGVGMLYLYGRPESHAVAYAHGLISDPGRPADGRTWERLDEALRRYPGRRPWKMFAMVSA